ncbi:MAG: SpoIIE family protein phosphatase [Candidatus Eisenbacteria bacterium]
MRSEEGQIRHRTLVLRYIALGLMTAALAATIIASFWMIHLWIGYMHLHPGFWVSEIDNYGAWWDVGVIRGQGCLQVSGVDPGSAAAKAGIQAGDSLMAIDGLKLRERPQAFFAPFVGAKPGKKIQVEFTRQGATQTRDLILEESIRTASRIGYLGVGGRWLTPQLADSLGLKSPRGVLISDVVPGTPAAKAGLKPNDVILSLNGNLFEESQFAPLLEASPGKAVKIGLLRGNDTLFVNAKLGDKYALSASIYGSVIQGPATKLVWTLYFPPLLLCSLLLLVGAPVGWLRPRDRVAFECSLWFQSLGAVSLWMTNQPLWASWPNWALTAVTCFTSLSVFMIIPLTLRVFSVFPLRSRLGAVLLRWQWTAFAVSGLSALTLPGDLRFIYGWRPTWFNSNPLTRFLGSWFEMVLFVTILGLLVCLLAAQRIEARRRPQGRLRVLELSLVLSSAAIVVFEIVPYVLKAAMPSGSTGLVLRYFLPVGLFGASVLSFAYAILAHKVFGIRLIIRKGIQHLLLSRGVLIVEGLLLFLILEESIRHGQTRIGGSVPAVAGLAAVTSVFLMAGLTRVNRPVMHSIDRRFFRETYDGRRVLVGLSQQVSRIRDRDEILRKAGEAVLATLHPGRVAFLLRNPQDRSLVVAWRRQAIGRGTHLQVAQEQGEMNHREDIGIVASNMLLLEEGLAWTHVTSQKEGQRAEDDASSSRRLELLVALPSSTGLIGCMALAGKLSEEPFSSEDKELLVTVATQMGLALENAELLEVAKREAEQAKEIGIARQVQQNLFPKELPPAEGWQFAAICRPAKAVGGDYYDLFRIDEDHIGFALGDVSGKGLGPSLVMAVVQGIIRSGLAERVTDVAGLMAKLNEHLLSSTSAGMFITLFIGVLNTKTGHLRYVNGGHNPPMLVSGSGQETLTLQTGGPLVGIMPRVRFDDGEVSLGSGCLLAVFSDGVTEATNENGDMFGEQQLLGGLKQSRTLSAPAALAHVLESVDRFAGSAEQADDISLVVIKRMANRE